MCNNCCKCKKNDNICNIFSFIINLLNICLSITIITLSQLNKYNSEVSSAISKELQENFESEYFFSFSTCNENENRKEFGVWKGTVRGCGKNENNIADAKILDEKKNQCAKDEIFLDSIPEQKIFKFKNMTICAKTKKKYYDLLNSDAVVESNENCPEGKKNCGYIDTVNNKLCFDNNSDCPINYIQIKDNGSDPPKNVDNLNTIKGDKISIYYSNNPYPDSSQIPYIANTFKIADSEICALPNLYHSKIDFNNLEAIKKQYSKDCVLKGYSQEVTFDKTDRYHAINTINQYELYEENGIIDKIIKSNLTKYGFNIEKYRDNELKLYVRRAFGFKKSCLRERKTEFNQNILDEIHSVSENMYTWSIVITASSIVIVICSFLDFFKICGDKIGIMIIKYFLMNAPTLISFFYTFLWGVYLDDSFEEKMDCSDPITNSNYNIMIYKIQEKGKFIYVCSILILIILIFNISIITVRSIECCCSNCCRNCCSQCCKKLCPTRNNGNETQDTNIIDNNKNYGSKIGINNNNIRSQDKILDNINKINDEKKIKKEKNQSQDTNNVKEIANIPNIFEPY